MLQNFAKKASNQYLPRLFNRIFQKNHNEMIFLEIFIHRGSILIGTDTNTVVYRGRSFLLFGLRFCCEKVLKEDRLEGTLIHF